MLEIKCMLMQYNLKLIALPGHVLGLELRGTHMVINSHGNYQGGLKKPSKALFIWEPPSELFIRTVRHPPVATIYGRLPRMLENDKSSHDPELGNSTAQLSWNATSLEDKEERNTINTIKPSYLKTSDYRFSYHLFHSTYSTQTDSTPPTLHTSPSSISPK